MKQNVTVAISKDVLKKAKLIAVQNDTSLSRLITEALEEIVARHSTYEEKKSAYFELLDNPRDLGTNGVATWTRDELHER